ncbi:LPD7 domain-containing protein [Kingella negevensis]|uniref:LPD7 domain-containing protein n=1 Tax=Kingella negevensis TaxID=1522312 RepID=UPI000A7D3C4A|nr:LPD7 domain-containing protein [Kingella negevensis]MDK4688271.1 PriCT-2 domain-containing protein [Kingella negevensis]
MSDYEEIRKALTHLDANDRDFWVRMGAAVKDELGEDGFELWDEWSRQSDTYKPNDAKAVWKSLKQGHIHIGTLFYHARENGYRPDKPYTPPSAEELAKRAQAAQEKQRAEAERIAKDHAKAAKTAYGIWKNASPADPNHAYAKNKGLGLSEAAMNAIRQNEYNGKKQLIIPLYSDKKLVNVQTIDEDGNKSFLSGGQKQGAYTVIGDFRQHQNGVILAEGYATAASVHQATGKPVIVAFDAGNLKAVSEKLVNVLPENVPVYFAADNDPKETGLVKAQAAAQIWGERAQIAMPTFSAKQIDEYQAEHGKFDSHGNENVPTDFNDLHKLAGIEAVRETFGIEPEPYIIETETDIELNRQPESEIKSEIEQHGADIMQEHDKPDVPREELLKNNYWRVQNGYDPLPENDQQPEQTTYSADNPYAQWAEHDDEVRHNADSWEMRTPLTNERLAHFNQQAEQYGFTTRIESSSGELGVFQADKWVNETYHVEIDGQFKNHGSMATYEAAHDFTMSFHENDEIVHYVYTNHLDDALQQANDFLQNPAEWIKEQDLKMQAEAMQPENAPPEYDYMPEYSSDDNELPPYYPPEYFEQLSTEPPTATSEKDVAVSVSEQEEQPEKIVSEYAKQMISELSQQHGWTQGGEDRAYKNVDDERTLVAYANEQYLTLGENDVDGGRDIVYSVDTQQTSPQLAADVFNQYADRYAQGEHIRPQDVEIALQQRNQSVQPAPETTIPEPPQRRQPESELAQPTATSEKDVAVPVSEQQETTPEIQTEQQPEMFNGIEYGGFQREIRLPEKQPESQPEPQTEPATEPVQPTPPTAEKVQPAPQPDVEEPELSRPETLEQPQPILDLTYEKPPKHLQSRYIVAENGQYLSADNHTTVLFEDKGNALKTAKSDQQTIQDMLEVAKAKGWDSIKISGSPEFKSMMYVAAESQGIKTTGYKPTPADLAMVEKLREDRSLNGIQSTHKPELDPSKQPEKPDVAALSAADKLKTQSAMPDERQINSSPIADTEAAPKIESLGNKTIQPEVLRSSQEMTTAALSPEVANAKAAYNQKAQQLSEPNQARLKAYERNTMDVLRDVQGDARNHALRNYYEYTTNAMNGTELNLPQPMQNRAPTHHQAHEPQQSNSQDFEMER